MSINEPRSIHAAEDWGVVLQSVPSKHKKAIVKRLQEIFDLDKRDAEQVLSNMPLILIDNVSFGMAARIKKYFQTLGAVTETTNHDMIKKNCFQIVWPQIPDLAFFLKDEAKSVEASPQTKKEAAKPAETPALEKKFEKPVVVPDMSKTQETPPPVAEDKTAAFSPASADSDWEKRAQELNEKLRKIQGEKQRLHEQHVEVTEKVKSDFQQKLEQEKRQMQEQHVEVTEKAKNELLEKLEREKKQLQEQHVEVSEKSKGELQKKLEQEKKQLQEQHVEVTKKVKNELQKKLEEQSKEISKAQENLRAQAQKQEALSKEGEGWRSKAMKSGEKVRELETILTQKASAVEHLTLEKDGLFSRVTEHEKTITAKNEEVSGFQARVSDLEKNVAATKRELENYQSRDEEWSRKAASLEREAQKMKESLQARDSVLAQFEKQMLELAEKVRGHEALRQENAMIREEYDAKLSEQEVRLAKAEDEHRRYRSRVDRKNAAAIRELGESVRSVDTARQGLQKLILFLGNDSAVLDPEKKIPSKSPQTRGPAAANSKKS